LARDIGDLLVRRNIEGNELRASPLLAPKAVEKTLIFIPFLRSELHFDESPKTAPGPRYKRLLQEDFGWFCIQLAPIHVGSIIEG
jgi:hypothetical protein